MALEYIVMINCRTEMLYGWADLKRGADAPPSEDGDCTGLVVLPARSASGRRTAVATNEKTQW